MASARARANLKLYHASIQLGALERELGAGEVPVQALHDAFAPAVLMHLQEAYGWFLLELAGVDKLPEHPPASVDEVLPLTQPDQPQRGELVELGNLEQQGSWLQRLLESPAVAGGSDAVVAHRSDNLLPGLVEIDGATAGWDLPGLRELQEELGELMDRMSNSLDEW